MNYGLPYKGSKSAIAMDIVAQLPSARTFVDLFAGGCAVTHAAMLSGRYEHFIANDILGTANLFGEIASGKHQFIDHFVTREEFELFKHDNMEIALCYSFGNNLRSYCYGRDLESYKHALYNVICGKTVNERRLAIKTFLRELKKLQVQDIDKTSINSLERLERLERLESLESLQRLQRLQSLETFQGDYQEITIPEDSVIYCDIPYRGTEKYIHSFDYDRFYEWALKQKNIFISEYSMPDGFSPIWEKKKSVSLSANATKHAIEKLFVPTANLKETSFQSLLFDIGEQGLESETFTAKKMRLKA